jgi:hypothetical protein
VFDPTQVPGYTQQLFGKMTTPGIWNANFIHSPPIAAEAYPFAGGNGTRSGAPQIFNTKPTTSTTHLSDTPATSSSASSPSDASTTAYVVPQMFSEMLQPYGLHNLNRQSLFLADGTECIYFTLLADYPLEQATPPTPHSAVVRGSVAAPPSVAAQVACLAPGLCSNANNTTGESMLLYNLQVPTTIQDASSVFKEMPVS